MNYSEHRPRIWLALAALVLVLLSGGAYLLRSAKPASVAPKAAGDAAAPAGADAAKSRRTLSDEQLERMVAQALVQTRQEPRNAPAWAMLAHSYEMLGKFGESAKAYTTLLQLLPNDAQVLTDYADVLAVVNGRSLQGEPEALLKRALAIDAGNAKTLLLAGSARFEAQDFAQAIAQWERARAASGDPALQRQIDANIAQAKAASNPAPAVAAVVPAQVAGRVWLAQGLRDKVPAQATLFLYARAAEGSRMPVVLLRKKVSDLPLNFTLDDSMRMVPNASLSKLSGVVVVARISLRGDVTPAPGDLQGVSAPVPVGTGNLKLEISEVLK